MKVQDYESCLNALYVLPDNNQIFKQFVKRFRLSNEKLLVMIELLLKDSVKESDANTRTQTRWFNSIRKVRQSLKESLEPPDVRY